MPVKLNEAGVSVFVCFAGDDGHDASLDQVLVDPLGSLPFVASEKDGRDDFIRFIASHFARLKKLVQATGLMGLAR
nr:hypothetical protein [Bremerella volcania]